MVISSIIWGVGGSGKGCGVLAEVQHVAVTPSEASGQRREDSRLAEAWAGEQEAW